MWNNCIFDVSIRFKHCVLTRRGLGFIEVCNRIVLKPEQKKPKECKLFQKGSQIDLTAKKLVF